MKKIISIMLMFMFILPGSFALDKPHLEKYVNDFADVLDLSCEDKINNLAGRIEENSTAEIAIVTMDSLCDESGCEDLEQYANELFRESGIGKKEKNNGIMILVFIKDRKYRVEVGYGLEGDIPDILASQIAERYMTPKFKEGNYCDGLYDTVYQIGEYIQDPNKKNNDDEVVVGFIIILLIVIFIVFIIFILKKSKKGRRRKSYWFGSGRGGGSSGGGGFGGGSSGGGGASGRW